MSAHHERALTAGFDREIRALREHFGDYRTAKAKARIEYVNAAAKAIRPSGSAGMFSTPETKGIDDVSDVIYLADYIERGPESYWLQRDEEATK